MAMFGAGAKRKGPFDFSPEIYHTPGIGDGLPGATPMGEPGLGGIGAPVSSPAATPKQPGASFLGILADALAGAAGQAGPYAAMVQQRRQQARQDQLYQRQRQDGLTDYATKQMIEARYAKPGALPDVIQLQTIADDPTQPANIRKAALDRVAALNDPIVNANVGGRDFFGPRSLLLDNLGKGGDPSSQVPGAAAPPSPAAPSTGGSFMTVGQYQAMRQSMGAGYDAWSKKYAVPVQVTTPDDLKALPTGTIYVGPDNVKRRK